MNLVKIWTQHSNYLGVATIYIILTYQAILLVTVISFRFFNGFAFDDASSVTSFVVVLFSFLAFTFDCKGPGAFRFSIIGLVTIDVSEMIKLETNEKILSKPFCYLK